MRVTTTMWRFTGGIFVLSLVATAGCISSDDGANRFRLCGNMVIDRNEQCDDGNLADIDDCLATCAFNVCGDEFLNSQGPQNIEQCDGRAINRTCASLGFQSGTLACTGECTFDTSGCTPRPTPPPTPTATPRGA